MKFIKRKVVSVKESEDKITTYDMKVKDSHHYILKNGVVSHNTQDLFPKDVQSGGEGLNYSASAIVYLSIAKFKSGEEDDLDLNQSGVVVTAQSRKNRLAKPKKVKFTIDFSKGVNPYQGLEYFCTPENFDKVGIAKVKVEKDKKGEVKVVGSGIKYYVRHLDKSLYEKQIFNKTVFNDDVLKALDPIISEYFTYSSYEEIQKELEVDIDAIEENDMDDLSDGDLFDN